MAAYAQHYHHAQEQLHFIDSHPFNFGQYDAREKTPTDSLLNHTGLSPLPLTATPPLSRNPSRQPEPHQDQQPDPLLWDNGSFSDSPTSVRTPDGDSFEVEMLDSESAMRNFYQQGQFGMSTQVSQNTIPAVDPNALFTPHGTFTNHAVDAAFNATMASHVQQFPQQYHGQHMQQHDFRTSQPQQHSFNANYTAEPLRHDPWNGQGPARSSMTPRTGGVIFDAVTDPVNYSEYLTDVESWTMNYSDPSFMISPTEQAIPQDNFLGMAQHNLVHRPQLHIPQAQVHNPSPVEMQLTRASPSPDQQNFVNYNASSSLFTDTYTTHSQYSPSSPGNSSNGHYPRSPFQPTISPAAASPASDNLFPYQHSEEMMLDPVPVHQFHHMQPHTGATIHINYPSTKGKEVAFDPSPEPELSHGGAIIKITGKSGGRQLGTHLEPTVAKAAHDMRKITACWHCVLQRDRCGPGDVCERCLKRSQRPNADCGLGCSRIKLVDLSTYFLPGLVTQMHEDSHLKHFVSQYIHQWGNTELTVYMTCGQHTMPRIPVKVYEFVPRGSELLVQIQYLTNPVTKQRESVRKQSPALGMVHINHNEEKTYDKYISDIVDNHLDAFGELCWKEDDNDFLQKLFRLMTRVKPKSDEEGKLLREVFRLVVVTFIMSHTLTIAEETKHATLARMHSYGGANSYYENFTSPRMTNRQLKYFFSRLQKSIQTTVLNKLQQIFKSSKGCDKWLAAFVAVLGMCMALEDQQKTIHQVMSTRSTTEGTDMRDAQAQADIACQEIDTRVHFVQQIFRWKYNRKHNPLVNTEHDWEKESGFGDASSVNFVRQVAQLVKENTDFLQQQQRVSISCANSTKYSSRLVGQFLLSFWLPNA